jgi:hypothetical protein
VAARPPLNRGRALVCVGRVRGASSFATIEIIQCPHETPRGGTFGFSKSVLTPAPKTCPKTVFETKLLIYLSLLMTKESGPTAPTRCQNDYGLSPRKP